MDINSVSITDEDNTFNLLAKAFEMSLSSKLVKNEGLAEVNGFHEYMWNATQAELHTTLTCTFENVALYEEMLKGVSFTVVIDAIGKRWFDLKYQVVCNVRDLLFDQSTGTYTWNTIEKVEIVDLTNRGWLARLVRWVLRIKG